MERSRGTTEKRKAVWVLEKLSTIRQNLVLRAGRLTRPQGKLTLTFNGNENVQKQLKLYLQE
ncbi:MAG: hypothetical protein HQK51_02400 [Oligoflexia bacterium]|nr:hypothetical protein [Oligoflexia bacterium]